MSDANVSRIGQIDGAGDVDALFLKVFSGMTLAQFRKKTEFLRRHTIRSIKSGKSAQFPLSGVGGAFYHTPGQNLNGLELKIPHGEKVITIDDVLIAPRSLAEIDDLKNHYDVRSDYANDAADALAQQYDANVAAVGILAARSSATLTGGNGGTVITAANSDTDGDVLYAAIKDAAQALDEKNVPKSDRWAFLRPDQFYALLDAAKIINKDYTEGSNGGVDSGQIRQVAGIPIVMTNNLPSTNITSGPVKYQGNFSTTQCLVMHRGAVGTVKLMDIRTAVKWQEELQTWLMLAKYAVGHDKLRHECAVEIKTS